MCYTLDMADYKDVRYLGERDPNVAIAEQLKKIRDDWKYVPNGFHKLKVDTYNSSDRKLEEDEITARFNPPTD